MTVRAMVILALAVAGTQVACGGDVAGGNTGGGTGSSTSGAGGGTASSSSSASSSSTSSSSSASSSSTSSSSSGGACTSPCCQGASCKAVDLTCVGLVDNAGLTKFGLRMSEFALTAPAALSKGIVAAIFSGAAEPSNPGCHLNGAETFNWLLQFDTVAGTLKTGGAKPVPNATSGYSFVNEIVQGKPVKPVTFTGVAPDANGNFSVTQGADLIMPIYLDPGATAVFLLPIKRARFTMGKLSASQNCIGHYNAEGLDPANSCLPDAQNKTFVTGAELGGMITLEDADSVIISSLNQSLCVLISDDPATYGVKNGMNVTVCKRTNGVINLQGDTCSTAGGTCKDSVQLSGTFAASSIQINN